MPVDISDLFVPVDEWDDSPICGFNLSDFVRAGPLPATRSRDGSALEAAIRDHDGSTRVQRDRSRSKDAARAPFAAKLEGTAASALVDSLYADRTLHDAPARSDLCDICKQCFVVSKYREENGACSRVLAV